ncbi:thioredoxin fold domain-containing protein [Empedobacter brevis]|uniref:thioredoxin fold domain-containing protein n=1 Tax=Empedobacter brevis TaxID=247 RepID=UPI0039AF436B
MKIWYFIFFLSSLTLNAQITLEKFNADFNKKPKPILLYFSTNWCSYCMIQKKQIKKDDELLQLLDNEIYFIEFDAETKKSIIFLNKEYEPKSNGKIHSFLEEFIDQNEQISYPYWVLISEDFKIEMTYNGLIKNKPLKLLLKKYLQKP